MKVNILEFLKTLPQQNDIDHGVIIGFDKIYVGLKCQHGIDNKDLVEAKLSELAKAGYIKIHRLYDDEDEQDVIVGVSFV